MPRPVTESKGMLYEQNRMQNVRWSVRCRPRFQVAADVGASWLHRRLNRGIDERRVDPKRDLAAGPVLGTYLYGVVSSAS